MKRSLLKIIWPLMIVCGMIMFACVEPYSPEIISQDVSLLVVDGFLNSKDGIATVKLTRTLPVYSKDAAPVEQKAQVKIIDDNGTEFLLSDKGNGVYERSAIPVNPSSRYRISIFTSNGEEYTSAAVPVKPSPKIDSVFWLPSTDGIKFYVNTSDPTQSTRYYRWEVTETYEYHSTYGSIYKISGSRVVTRPPSEQINQCWRTIPPTDIHIASSSSTTNDVISNLELNFVEKGSVKLSQRYSILVRQYAVTEEAFDYWRELEQSTEKLGSLFDPMPSQITGNITNISNIQKPALGYFSAGTYDEKRIYVNFNELPPDLQRYSTGCVMDTIPANEIGRYNDKTLLIGSFGDPVIIGYLTSDAKCIDCRTLGGTTTKPSFWK